MELPEDLSEEERVRKGYYIGTHPTPPLVSVQRQFMEKLDEQEKNRRFCGYLEDIQRDLLQSEHQQISLEKSYRFLTYIFVMCVLLILVKNGIFVEK